MKKGMTILAMAMFLGLLTAWGGPASAGNGTVPFRSENHYKCYKLKFQEFEKVPVKLFDQFDSEQERDAVVVRPMFFCNPVQKTHGPETFPIQRPELHYTCYLIREKRPPVPDVTAFNQFGEDGLEIDRAATRLLCAPSCKNDPFCESGGSGE